MRDSFGTRPFRRYFLILPISHPLCTYLLNYLHWRVHCSFFLACWHFSEGTKIELERPVWGINLKEAFGWICTPCRLCCYSPASFYLQCGVALVWPHCMRPKSLSGRMTIFSTPWTPCQKCLPSASLLGPFCLQGMHLCQPCLDTECMHEVQKCEFESIIEIRI